MNRPKDRPNIQSSSAYSRDAAAAGIWPSTDRLIAESLVSDIADQATAADESGVLSTSVIELLRNAGYFGLPVPSQLDGGGASLLECAAIQRRLGRADPALAIAVNMHLFSVGMAVEHWMRNQDACGLLLSAIASQHRILASAFAEPGLGGALLRSHVKATRKGRGYLVEGIKSPCSLAAHCDLVCLQMQADPIEPEGLMMALIPSNLPGIRIERTWDSLGMRASGSDTLRIEQCFVPDELIFHRCEPGFDEDEVFAAGLIWFCVTTTATYLGVVNAAFDAALEELHSTVLPNDSSRRATLPSVQAALGESVSRTLALEASCAGVAERIDRRQCDARSLLPTAVAIKHVAVEICIRAVGDIAELIGGKSYARTGKLARLWRDVQAARFHPPNRLVARQLLGRWVLQLPLLFEVDERAPAN
jgi:alkylation response protein AidB-like acyl-CoA dehydrogenase